MTPPSSNEHTSISHLAVVFPKVPAEVRAPVAPLFREWAAIAEAYESNPGSPGAAWLYLGHHPAFWELKDTPGGCHVVTGTAWYRCIETGFEQDDTVWMEIQPSYWPEDPTWEEFLAIEPNEPERVFNLSGFGTFESVLLTGAETVHAHYRNDREFLKLPLLEKWWG